MSRETEQTARSIDPEYALAPEVDSRFAQEFKEAPIHRYPARNHYAFLKSITGGMDPLQHRIVVTDKTYYTTLSPSFNNNSRRVIERPLSAREINEIVDTARRLSGRKEMGVDEAIEVLRRVGENSASLDVLIGEGEDITLGLSIPDETANTEQEALRAQLVEDIDRVLATLPKRERNVLNQRFGRAGNTPMTLEEVGREHGVTRERIRQIEKKKRFRG